MTTTPPLPARLALYGFHRGDNGIGRIMCNLANGVAAHGVAVDVLEIGRAHV